MTVQVRPTDGALVVSGELDMAGVDDFRQFAARWSIPRGRSSLDIEELEFVDSSGIKAILRLAETVCPHGIVLRWPRDNVLRVLDILNVEGVRGIRVERRPSGGPSYEGPERSASRNIPTSTARSVRSSSAVDQKLGEARDPLRAQRSGYLLWSCLALPTQV